MGYCKTQTHATFLLTLCSTAMRKFEMISAVSICFSRQPRLTGHVVTQQSAVVLRTISYRTAQQHDSSRKSALLSSRTIDTVPYDGELSVVLNAVLYRTVLNCIDRWCSEVRYVYHAVQMNDLIISTTPEHYSLYILCTSILSYMFGGGEYSRHSYLSGHFVFTGLSFNITLIDSPNS